MVSAVVWKNRMSNNSNAIGTVRKCGGEIYLYMRVLRTNCSGWKLFKWKIQKTADNRTMITIGVKRHILLLSYIPQFHKPVYALWQKSAYVHTYTNDNCIQFSFT